MAAKAWWQGRASERFWLEATDRADIGADLRAPLYDESGADNWRYTLFQEARPGDIVFHYDKASERPAIVGFSRVAGAWFDAPIIWAARGTYAREKGTIPHERPGYRVPLEGYTRLSRSVTLDDLRVASEDLRRLVDDLERTVGAPLYFPFELSEKRPLRLLQGYAFKLPAGFVELFPQLMPGGAPVEDAAPQASAAPSGRNPTWSRDELILALELYKRNPVSPPGKTSTEVLELSGILNQLGSGGVGEGREKYRNPNGVYMKMMNFRRFDPAFIAEGRVGLARGGKDEEAVWAEFADDPVRLRSVAEAIRQAVALGGAADTYDEPDIAEAEEGRVLTRLHRTRERSRELVRAKKAQAQRELGRLECEVCRFDFAERYGERGQGFIEVHHTKPLHTLSEGQKTRLEDLALLCANCHRMVHATRPWLGLEELRFIFRPARSAGAEQAHPHGGEGPERDHN